MKNIFLTVSFLFLLTSHSNLLSQDTINIKKENLPNYYNDKLCKIIYKNGFIQKGYVLSEDSASLNFVDENKKSKVIQKNQISIIVSPSFNPSSIDDFIKIDTINTKRIELIDGSEIIGKIETIEIKGIKFKTQSGIKMFIPGDDIYDIETISIVSVDGNIVIEDPNQTRLFLAPTAIPLKSGRGYFSVDELMFPVVACGVTDFLSLGGGVTLFPFATNQLYYIIGKAVPLKTKYFDLAGGFLYSNLIGSHQGSGFGGIGLAYIVSSYFSSSTSFTTGVGFGYFDGIFHLTR